MAELKVGDAAPEFSARGYHGETIRLADFRDKQTLLLFFYPRDHTSVCTQEACAFRDAFEAFTQAGAAVVGVSSDDETSHRKFAENHRLPFPLISDPQGTLRKAFGVPATLWLIPGRVTYVIDSAGIVRHIFNSLFTADRHVQEALAIVKQLSKAA